ncbi:unnamed protein product [Haemonchus placei]|uniref:Secreted protein n=1 Tax=Haemonchus placei TaxID=6290 RepID=A0A0N4W546_HAEPC|nr:unnamed protein product [Haemonchus placei]
MESILSGAVLLSVLETSMAIYGCPTGGLLSSVLGGVGSGYGGYGGFGYGRCGPDTIFYHWTCCDYNVYDCCIQLETWVM